ncbi:MAG TPA: hypothetical protein VNU21_06360, partial [Usitatibacter sp.]|nr:hypothetical protein [Usitatibacter sp.]
MLQQAREEVASLENQPYRTGDIRGKAARLEALNLPPDADGAQVQVSLVLSSVENCADKELDVVYWLYSTRVLPSVSATPESRKLEASSPERALGLETTGKYSLVPRMGYDPAQHLYAGGRWSYRNAGDGRWPVDFLGIDAIASGNMHDVSIAGGGSVKSLPDWATLSDWQLQYLDKAEPSEGSVLRKRALATQWVAMTRPLGSVGLPARLGGSVELGSSHSGLAAAASPADAITQGDYGLAKLYLGTIGSWDRQSFAGSIGVEAGSSGTGGGLDWIKYVGDISHNLAIRVGDHRNLDIDSRLSGGYIDVRGEIPIGARFFGGAHEESFIAGDSWNLRSNPVVRSIPANHFALGSAGGTRFVSYNLTAGVPLWRRPMVPSELYGNAEFGQYLEGQLNSATSVLQTDYEATDARFKAVMARMEELGTQLSTLDAAVRAARAASPGQLHDLFDACDASIVRAQSRIKAALKAKGGGRVGYVQSLLDEDRLSRIQSACIVALNSQVHDEAIAHTGVTILETEQRIRDDMAAVDHAAAAKNAGREMGFVRTVINRLVYDLNIAAVGPVFMFDIARMSAPDHPAETKRGIGAGL